MILADTSVWIDHLRGLDTDHTSFLRDAIASAEVVMGDLVLMEILQGVRDDHSLGRVRASLSRFPTVRLAHRGIPMMAANNHRALRRNGYTPQNAVDTIIATYCSEHQLELLHSDRDFDAFEEHLGLRTVSARP